ncbi:MAG: DUF1735 and LamG domain-containing protein [Mediterranea sp.]|jgi:hypothetical protein|nr:DUF1735 and LamG domain-containing protein [Mediterranea sp.]
MKKIDTLVALAACLLLAAACDNTDYTGRTPADNGVYLNVAETKTSEVMTFNKTIDTRERTFAAKLAFPVENEVTVGIAIDPALVDEFNASHNTRYVALPEKHRRLEADKVSIPAGKVNSPSVRISFTNLTELAIDQSYLCPVTLTGSQGADLLRGSSTYWYVVRRSSAITTAVDLKNCYVEVPGFYVPNWGTEPQGNAARLNGLKAVTLEMLVRVGSFDEDKMVDITSLIGIEQYLCFRIGDAGFNRRQLQVQTPAGKFPEANKAKLLNVGEWYHLALTYDIAGKTIAIYVNGQEQSRSTNYGNSDFSEINLANRKMESAPAKGDGDWLFYVGRSYNDRWLTDRQLNGNVCEVRVWDVARTRDEIWEHMYDVDAPEQETHLLAYWKFNEGTGDNIKDYSSLGNDAHIVRYWKTKEPVEEYDVSDTDLWPSGIEVPQLNKTE